MPLYEFQVVNQNTGEVLETINLPLAVDDRDAATLRRAPLPRSLAIQGHAEDPTNQANQVLNGYKRIEQRIGNNSEFQRKIGHSAEQVKVAWGNP